MPGGSIGTRYVCKLQANLQAKINGKIHFWNSNKESTNFNQTSKLANLAEILLG